MIICVRLMGVLGSDTHKIIAIVRLLGFLVSLSVFHICILSDNAKCVSLLQ